MMAFNRLTLCVSQKMPFCGYRSSRYVLFMKTGMNLACQFRMCVFLTKEENSRRNDALWGIARISNTRIEAQIATERTDYDPTFFSAHLPENRFTVFGRHSKFLR
ncbi:hypothetical protein CEV32_2215 [Brucella rhizosphaerae]|uniref:Uncharacterized protein n=1 Tax=Brucella rhizosphaerae TaxID=571254 RepID=A0A256F4L7_9HYPH|nr:hypothetical protein CEV32_2215 [Brucella rhizosphaerae]